MKLPPRRSRPKIVGSFRSSLAIALLGLVPAVTAQQTSTPAPQPAQPATEKPQAPEEPAANQPAAATTPVPLPEPKPVGPVVYFQPFDTNTVSAPLTGNPGVSYLDSQIPQSPWLSADTPVEPDWAPTTAPRSPLLRPGLGTSAIGGTHFGHSSFGRGGPGATPIQLGPVDVRPRLGYQILYGSGLPSLGRNSEATLLHTVSPGVAFNMGRYWSVNYAPSIRIYDQEGYENTVNHTVTLNGGADWENWHFGLRHATAITSDPLVETGQQTDQTVHTTAINGRWKRNPRGTYSFSIDQRLRDTTRANNVNSWSMDNAYDYAVRPKLRVGLGVGVGYDMVEPGSDMIDQDLSLRVSGPLGDRIDYHLSGGAGFREFMDSDASTAITPKLGLNITYRMLEMTMLSVGASHGTSTSYFSDQFTENTTVQGGVTQRLSERWSVSASGGLRLTNYRSTKGSTSIQREDTTTFATVSTGTQILTRLSLSIFYSYRANASDSSSYGFDSHQVGMSLQWSL
ncbi:MAG: hypothetical protein IT581_05535 [Verrucomicrobiales bacterium]|nr:hypothetical protein [Verrucomicrobiales bacterium]